VAYSSERTNLGRIEDTFVLQLRVSLSTRRDKAAAVNAFVVLPP